MILSRPEEVVGGGAGSKVAQSCTSPQRKQLVLQHIPGIRAFIHEIQLGDDADGPQA